MHRRKCFGCIKKPLAGASSVEQALKPSVPPSDTRALQRQIELLRERLANMDAVIDDLLEWLDADAEKCRRTR
jgi:hypothetical protein